MFAAQTQVQRQPSPALRTVLCIPAELEAPQPHSVDCCPAALDFIGLFFCTLSYCTKFIICCRRHNLTGCTGPSPLARPCADHGRPPVVLVLPQHDGEEAHARQRAPGGRAPRAVTATDGGDCLRGKGGQRKRGDDCPAVVSMNKMSLGKRAGRRRLLAPLFFRLLCLRRLLRLLYADLRELKEVTWAANGGARTRRPAYSMYITTNRLYYVKAPPVVNEHKHVNSGGIYGRECRCAQI